MSLGSGLVVFLTSSEFTELLTASDDAGGFVGRVLSLATLGEPFWLTKMSDPCEEDMSRVAAGSALFWLFLDLNRKAMLASR